jgi:ribosomal protein L11 methyltransferase
MAQAFTLELRAGADAFGDGSHPSTQGAIVALEALSHLQGLSCALDVGCGSGLLALQMAYQWHIPVVATDINAHAVAATQANAEYNRLTPLITAVRADGYQHKTIQNGAPYSLITCNWLAEHLHAHASELAAHLAEEGITILSGILQAHEASVLEAHTACGLTLLQKIRVGDWVTLMLQK